MGQRDQVVDQRHEVRAGPAQRGDRPFTFQRPVGDQQEHGAPAGGERRIQGGAAGADRQPGQDAGGDAAAWRSDAGDRPPSRQVSSRAAISAATCCRNGAQPAPGALRHEAAIRRGAAEPVLRIGHFDAVDAGWRAAAHAGQQAGNIQDDVQCRSA